MSDTEERSDKRPDEEEVPPTASFSNSVAGPGGQIGPFRIERELGRGAVGVVYLAHDTKLDRSVAIKSLPAEVMANPKARSRFSREARLLASLNHPNIATIYEEFEEVEGVGYLILEYVPGQTLAERIAKKPFKLEETLSIALQIAEAVAAAHEHDVIHRDLKPGNIKITPEGKVKVLDFGLAKAVGGKALDQQSTVTEPGRVIGTPTYMSPEQARGKPADKRSDIWSFGCVLYEMLSGRVPFKGETISDTLANILQTDPEWHALPPTTPANILVLLRRCLEKEPRRRLRDISDIAITLEETATELQRSTMRTKAVEAGRAKPTKWSRRALPWLITGTAVAVLVLFVFIIGLKLGRPPEKQAGKPISQPIVKPIKAIVVLPFENLSGDPEQEYFVDGMTDALSAELGKIKALRVISRTSAMQYKDTDKVIPEIAKELGVDAVIEGSVLKAGNDVRVTAQLVDGRTDTHLWSENYTGTLTNILALQSEVTLAIAREIEAALTPEEEQRIAGTESVNPDAYEAYLKGRYYWNKRTEEGLARSIEYFQEAIEGDPGYALAHAGMADAYNMLGAYDAVSPVEAFPRAEAAAIKALEIDSTLAEAHTSLAWTKMWYDWDWSGAEKEYKRAIQLNRSYATAYHWYGWYLAVTGQPGKAIAEFNRAQELDPLSLIINAAAGWNLYAAREYDQAIEQLRRTLDMDPDFPRAHYWLGESYLQKGMLEDAITEFQKTISISRGSPQYVAALGYAYAVAGKTDEAQKVLNELKELSKRRYVSPYGIALVYTGLANQDQVFEWLEKAYEERAGWLALVKVEPRFHSLRSDPRFQKLLRRMNFPEAPVSGTAAEPIETAQAPIEKIAVLPFTSISSESGEEWFVDGMTDALITQLGKIKALTVISRTSAMQYKNISKPMREIAQDLGVDALIEGSVIRAGNDVQVTARLIDGRTDERIWGDFFQGTFSDILALQSQVTLAIAREIEVALTPEEQRRITRTEPVNPEAYEAYLKGIFFTEKMTEESLKTAADYFNQAIEIEPDYAEAYAWLSAAYWLPSALGYGAPDEGFTRAKTAANTAIKLDETCGNAHGAVGWIALFCDWDWQKAKLSLERGIDLNPNDSYGYHGLAWYLVVAGRFDEAIDAMQTAVKLDPHSPVLNNNLANMYRYSGQVERAVEQREKTLELTPGFVMALSDLAEDYLSMSMYPEAVATIEKAMSLAGRTPRLVAMLGRAYALSGRKDQAETLLQELQERAASEYVLPTYFAALHTDLGNTDEAFRWLEKAYQERDYSMFLLRMPSSWGSLRSDPRFDDLVRRMGFPE